MKQALGMFSVGKVCINQANENFADTFFKILERMCEFIQLQFADNSQNSYKLHMKEKLCMKILLWIQRHANEF